jgi:hypothetical protein
VAPLSKKKAEGVPGKRRGIPLVKKQQPGSLSRDLHTSKRSE